MQTGPGGAYSSGVLGEHLQSDAGHAFRDGALGEYFAATSGLGAPMQTGPGRDFREGSLGGFSITSEMMLFFGIGAAVIYFGAKAKKKGAIA